MIFTHKQPCELFDALQAFTSTAPLLLLVMNHRRFDRINRSCSREKHFAAAAAATAVVAAAAVAAAADAVADETEWRKHLNLT